MVFKCNEFNKTECHSTIAIVIGKFAHNYFYFKFNGPISMAIAIAVTFCHNCNKNTPKCDEFCRHKSLLKYDSRLNFYLFILAVKTIIGITFSGMAQ